MAVVVDVGHNPQALGEFLRTLERRLRGEGLIFVFGTSSKKPADAMVALLQAFVRSRGEGEIYLVNGDNERSKPVGCILEEVRTPEGLSVAAEGNVGGTLARLTRDPANRGKVG